MRAERIIHVRQSTPMQGRGLNNTHRYRPPQSGAAR
jgi:hypothetical protein